MRRYLTLLLLLCLAIPAGMSISGCVRNPAGNYCNGEGFGLKITDVFAITLQPRDTGISLAFGQTRQITAPTAETCKGATATVSSYTYGTTNNQLVDISPTGNICAGRWNRNSGGGIADFTICNAPNPAPITNGLPYSTAFITAEADSITSNPVEVYVHQAVGAITLSLAGQQACYSQGQVEQLDSEACFSQGGVQYEFCAPPGTTTYACPGGPPQGATLSDCTAAIGVATYTVGTTSIASINSETNQITAEQPGTTPITASIAGSGSSAGYFSTCGPRSISVTLANGATSGTVTQGVQQNLTTTVYDTNVADCPPLGCAITGLTLDYQSTNPLDTSVGAGGAITAAFPGAASIYAICQPTDCNATPINQVGAGDGTGLSISSNAVNITTPGTASSFMWFSSPGQSQYFVPVELLTGSVGSTVRLPYVPNSMVMDQTGTNLYFGSSHELMIFTTASNTLSKADTTVPGVVLAVAPNNQLMLINDQVRDVFYLYVPGSGVTSETFGGLGVAAQWTPDAKTLYVIDSAAAGGAHSNTMYVYNANTGWTTYSVPSLGNTQCAANPTACVQDIAAQNLAVMVPGVGAYLSGNATVARTWCPSGTVGNYQSMVFYPQGDTIAEQNDVLAATADGQHILGAAFAGGAVTLNDTSVTIPTMTETSGPATPIPCPGAATGALTPLMISHVQNPPQTLTVNATRVNQVVTSPAAVTQGTNTASTIVSFVTYNGATAGATLPYYTQAFGSQSPGAVGYVTLNGASVITAPVAGAFSSDGTLFFVSTAGDNLIHYIDTSKLTDTQQINPNLPACAVGSDPDCMFNTTTIPEPASGIVPATAIAVKPRSTT